MKKFFLSMVVISLLLYIFLMSFPLRKKIEKLSFSRVVYDRNGKILRVFLSKDDKWRIKVKETDVSPFLKKIILNYEDKYFYYHFGFNPISLLRAFKENYKAKKIVQGGSTITMQVARLLYPRKNRSYIQKLKEIFLSLVLEVQLTKKEILELYLNLAPYGKNIEGVKSASYLYFGKDPKQLSISESAVLTMIPKSPVSYNPIENTNQAKKARNKVLTILYQNSILTKKEYSLALKETLPNKMLTFPFCAPHFTEWVTQLNKKDLEIISTLDLDIQNLCEKLVSNHIKDIEPLGIKNCAVVVLDNRTGNLLAMVGSQNFFDSNSNGQVNGATSPRSPGSLLKPFLYALAFNEGILTPKYAIFDLPVSYTGYCPENYDDKYRGLVTVREALCLSLNVPAVNIYAQMKNNGLYELLKKLKISSINKPKEYYGLSFILGSCEISLLDITQLYMAFANYGEFKKVNYILNDKTEKESQKIFSAGASWLITDILTNLERPDLPKYWELTCDIPKIAWKTGTSYGHKDAWAIGYNPDYTIGVWVGNFDGKGVFNLAGARCAVPLLFRIFNSLRNRSISRYWFFKPNEVLERDVCSLTGLLPNENCKHLIKDYYLSDRSINETCNVHKKFLIDKKTFSILCSYCKQNRESFQVILEQWPSSVATQLKKVGYPVPTIPEHFKDCVAFKTGEPPTIVSPEQDCQYFISKNIKEEYQKILFAASTQNDVKKVYWFVNDKLLFQGPPEKRFFFTPKAGIYEIKLMDDKGRTSLRKLEIQ